MLHVCTHSSRSACLESVSILIRIAMNTPNWTLWVQAKRHNGCDTPRFVNTTLMKWYDIRLLHIPDIHYYHHRLTDLMGKYKFENKFVPIPFTCGMEPGGWCDKHRSSCLTLPYKPALLFTLFDHSLDKISTLTLIWHHCVVSRLSSIMTLIEIK